MPAVVSGGNQVWPITTSDTGTGGVIICSELWFLHSLVAVVILCTRVVKPMIFFIFIVLIDNSLNEHSW